ncbi:MAG: hypothetical protein ACLFV8_11090, partial [Alphaproteobacteria bacterium]
LCDRRGIKRELQHDEIDHETRRMIVRTLAEVIRRVHRDTGAPDFEKLRAERNAGIRRMVEDIARQWDANPDNVRHNFNYDACYCACPDGPCEHDFKGWREFEDGNGGEQVCARCGMGAMTHSLRVAP